MEVQRLVNPAALDIPEVKAALDRWSNVVQWHDALKLQMSVGAATVIVGTADDTQIDAASIVTLPQAFTDSMPWVVHFHNDGPRALTHELVKATLDFIRDAGYNAYKAFNQSGKSDKLWLRAFKQGGKPKFIGSAYIFNLDEVISDGSNSANRRRPRAVRGRQRQPGSGRRRLAKQPTNRSNVSVVPKSRANSVRKSRVVHRRRRKSG